MPKRLTDARCRWLVLLVLLAPAAGAWAAAPEDAPDLNPVTFRTAPAGKPVELVREGRPLAMIVAAGKEMELAAKELQSHVELATGAKLPIAAAASEGASIVLAEGEAAQAYGIDVEKMPAEGFVIRTVPNGVVIAGRNALWGVYEFLERVVGVRWYFPGDLGRAVPRLSSLAIKPVWLAGAPVFRKRENWPANYPGGVELHRRLRGGQSWPHRIACHTPIGWPKYYADRPELFQLRGDGSRETSMLCYSNPATLQQYLTTIEEYYAGKYTDDKGKVAPGPWGWFPPDEHVISVSPNDAPVTCRCDLCRAKWDAAAGPLGEASALMADFVTRLAGEVKKRWPDKVVTYLAYSNYTIPPKGARFPGNVEVHVCGMRGLANYKETAVARSEQEILDGWQRISGRPLQNWHYICWPDDSTTAPYLFPHVLQSFYKRNRGKTVGTFINGAGNHWPRHHVSLYAWMKVMWNPDFPVDAAIDEYCRRMYGPAAKTMRRLLQTQMDGWEKSRWKLLPGGHNVSPKSVHEESYPPALVRQMDALLAQARREVGGDDLARQRLEYTAGPLDVFLKESRQYHDGTGRTPVLALKVGDDPKVDGRLDDDVWQRAAPAGFRRALDREHPDPTYPTTVQAVWTTRGVTLGFRMADADPGKLVMVRKAHDDASLWWDDNVELFLDPAGQRAGFYQWIVSAAGTTYDGSFAQGGQWNPEGVRAASYVGKEFWSCEIFIPYGVFRGEGIAAHPAQLSGKTWYGNFTRHRVSAPAEMQRLNTTFEGSNHNMVAFGPIRFVE